jgi:hypothetical protein
MIALILHIITGLLIGLTFVMSARNNIVGDHHTGALLWAAALISFTLLIKL